MTWNQERLNEAKAELELVTLGLKAVTDRVSEKLKESSVDEARQLIRELGKYENVLEGIEKNVAYYAEKCNEEAEQEAKKEAARETLFGGENNGR